MTFPELLEQLNSDMVERYVSVSDEDNPVARCAPEYGASQLQFLVGQYGFFPSNIAHFLLDAFYSLTHAGWSDCSDELKQNISEELFQDEAHLPHSPLLRQGLIETLDFDVARVSRSAATERFIADARTVMNNFRPAFIAGAVYAVESVAERELNMVFGIARQLHAMVGKQVHPKVALFFESHIDEIEVLHKLRFETACGKYVERSDSSDDFRGSFEASDAGNGPLVDRAGGRGQRRRPRHRSGPAEPAVECAAAALSQPRPRRYARSHMYSPLAMPSNISSLPPEMLSRQKRPCSA